MTFDANATNALTLALTNLNAALVRGRENKTVNYLTFSGKDNKDINDFIIELEKAFIINRVADNRKHVIAISCLKKIAANFYDRLAGITN